MTMPKGERRRENLSLDERAMHDRMAARVIWRNLVTFVRPADDGLDTDEYVDHGDQPYTLGNSLLDRERRGEVLVLHSPEWQGALQLFVDDGLGGVGGSSVAVMIDRQQVYRLATGLLRWLLGTALSWDGKPMKQVPHV